MQTIVAACGDTGSLSRDFPSPRSIISQTSAWGEREGGRKGERERGGAGHRLSPNYSKPRGDLLGQDGQQITDTDKSHAAPEPPGPKDIIFPSFLPHSFLSSPTPPAAFLTCLRETEGASRTDKQRHTTCTTRSQCHWLQPLSVCTEGKVLALAYQKGTPIAAHTCPCLVFTR